MEGESNQTVQMIPVAKITVVNPRARNRKIFREIIANIAQVGLKKPITVTKHTDPDGEFRYDLVCGQGRLEAFKALGQGEVPNCRRRRLRGNELSREFRAKAAPCH
jgi:ParB family chromosome partitioning protein